MSRGLVKFHASPDPDGCIPARTAIELADAIAGAARHQPDVMQERTRCLEGLQFEGSEGVFVRAIGSDLGAAHIVCWSPRATDLSRRGVEAFASEEFTVGDMPERLAFWLYPAITGMSDGARVAFELPPGREWVSPGALFMPCIIPPEDSELAAGPGGVDTVGAQAILKAGGYLALTRVDVFFWMNANQKMAHGPPFLRTHPPFIVGRPVDDAVGALYLAQSRFLRTPYATLVEEERSGLRPVERRRRHRNGQGVPKVHTITLRRIERVAAPTKEPGEGKQVDWSCRWDVEPHWRRQWYPSAGKHSPVFIAEYEKGPPDKPKREKRRTVFKATR